MDHSGIFFSGNEHGLSDGSFTIARSPIYRNGSGRRFNYSVGFLFLLLIHPAFVITAILGHGLWDLAKHRAAAGVPFFPWYTHGCAVFDVGYAFVLAAVFWRAA